MTRSEMIEAILAAARNPCPPIVPAVRLRDKTTGKTYLFNGVPFGVDHANLERVSIGFVYQDRRNGTTYGTIGQTEDELRQRHDSYEDRKAADFRAVLESATADRLVEQAAYWLKPAA